ncbi:hypothetical protein E6C60_1596 [Paenibacillus algicola]|uniref:Uncharacterized protein n=1 Tax=Paenibacillus algicola TaxID=2565926 RepID=A0A4P8XI93_9BACL|nr:hypothetical protein E6C60_1596 [Paenibacillus algicola]
MKGTASLKEEIFMGLGGTILAAVVIAVILIVPMFYTIKKGYSRKWDEE